MRHTLPLTQFDRNSLGSETFWPLIIGRIARKQNSAARGRCFRSDNLGVSSERFMEQFCIDRR